MLENLSLINFLIYAMAFGIAVAMIYTNIQRTALSKFINALIDKGCDSEESAMTAENLGLSGIYASIAKSAAKKQFGIKKAVEVVEPQKNTEDKLEALLDTADNNTKYYLKEDCDKETLLKRYNYETMSAKYIALFLLALVAIVIAAVFAVNLIIKNASVSKIESTEEPDQQTVEDISEVPGEEANQESEADNTDTEQATDENLGSVVTPTLPVSA